MIILMYRQSMEQDKYLKLLDNQIFEVNGFLIKIPKDKYENKKIYLERVLFIIKNLKKSDNLLEYIRLSRIYVNRKFLHCKYNISLSS